MIEHETFFSHKCFDGIWRNELSRNCLFCEKRKPIKPKEEKMEDPMIPVIGLLNVLTGPGAGPVVTLSEAERLGEEAKRIKAEIAKREEIGPGDWCQTGGKIFKCSERNGDYARNQSGDRFYLGCCKKLHPTPEVKAYLDSLVGGEG